MQKKFIIALCTLFATSSAYAFFCPKGLQMIEFGDTRAHVIQQCGKPDAEKKIQVDTSTNEPQEWIFNQGPTQQVRMMFTAQHISNISENGFPVASTDVCGTTISINDTIDTVKKQCPPPALINKNSSTNQQPQQTPQEAEAANKDFNKGTVEATYNSSPPVTLTFTDGILTGKK